jgi:murein DD-endopeptidase MepM/ murein hydrolase activator NlpD
MVKIAVCLLLLFVIISCGETNPIGPFNISVQITPEGSASIVPDTFPDIEAGTMIEISVIPNLGYSFDHWDGDIFGTEESLSIIVTKDIEITAVCRKVEFQFPLAGNLFISRVFGDFDPITSRYHSAEDYNDLPGTPVYAVSDGIISASIPALGYGWVITIDHPHEAVYSLYGNVSTRRWKRIEGIVKKGDLIAYLGDEDEITGTDRLLPSHLHFGVRNGFKSEYPGDTNAEWWTAGYTIIRPEEYGWLNPTEFIKSHTSLEN